MRLAIISEPIDFSMFKEVVKFARENDLHKAKGVTVCTSRRLKECDSADVKSGCSELHLHLKQMKDCPLPRFDHWRSRD